ncbi:MAG TPA: M28 family metallopeptidase, partial [Gammaproteobacteria bacterium]
DLAGDDDEYRLAMRAWITRDAAERLFAAAGLDFAELKQRALQPDFRAQPLGQILSITLLNEIEEITSANVIGVLPGETRAGESIVYTAHWDHLGVDESNAEDPVFNGAVDNASGVAGLLELAEAFGSLESRPDRTLVFIAVTAEESGLLGSKWYVENPVFPLEQTVAAINMDSMNVYGPTKDVVVVGYGNSELEDYLAKAVEEQGREIVPEEHPERGYYYRSDHFNFAKHGVPALYAESGSGYVGENAEEAARRAAAYTAEHYHKPSDEYADWWNLEGAVQDIQLYFTVGHELANSDDFPGWYQGNEFRAIREESAAARQGE